MASRSDSAGVTSIEATAALIGYRPFLPLATAGVTLAMAAARF